MKKKVIKRKEDGTFDYGTIAGKQFMKGNIPWNKGNKGLHLSPRTEFKKGGLTGSEHFSWKGGVQITKKDGVYLWDGANARLRRARKIYKDHYGEIPKGYVIYHKNGDNYDDRPENLEAISRAELLKRNREKNKINKT